LYVADLCGAHAAPRLVFLRETDKITAMTTQANRTKTTPQHATAGRNIQAIWSHKQSANISKPLPAHSSKEWYAADRATD
jgi:hypothetical protein